MIMGTTGEPRLDLGRLMRGIVVHDDMDVEAFGYVSVDLLEEVQEPGRPMSLVAFADDEAMRHRALRTAKSCRAARNYASGVRRRRASSARPAVRGRVPGSGSSRRC